MKNSCIRNGWFVSARALVAGLVFLAGTLVVAGAVQAAVWYVATDGDDGNDGSSSAPWATIAHAVAEAASGDAIRFADGTYAGPGNDDVTIGDKSLVIRSDSGVREACVLQCTFRLDGAGTVGFHDLTFAEASEWAVGPTDRSGIFSTTGDVTNCVFRDVAIGIWATGGGWTVRECLFEECGEGIRSDNFAYTGPHTLLLEDIRFLNCGTGLWFTPTENEDWQILDCVFEGNGVGAEGGTYKKEPPTYGSDAGKRMPSYRPIFQDCLFTGNGTGVGFCFEGGFRRCEFVGNNWAFFSTIESSMSLEECNIHDNTTGGIFFDGLYLYVSDTPICHNGGAAIDANAWFGFSVNGCVIYGNAGGGVVLRENWWNLSAGISGTTVAGNGAGIDCGLTSGELVVANTLVAYNAGEGLADAGAVYTNCCVFGNGPDVEPDSFAPDPLVRNQALAPHFCDLAAGDLGLSMNSPCRETQEWPLTGAVGTTCDAVSEITLVIDIEPDEANAPWELVGPLGDFYEGVGDFTLYQVPPGEYTVTWLSATGWLPPSPATVTQTTRPYLIKTIRGYYTALEGEAGVGGQTFGLLPNSPNPFNPATVIRFGLDRAATVDVEIYDLAGRRVRTLASGLALGPGAQSLRWDGADERGRTAAAGIYLVLLRAGEREDTRRIMLVK